MVVGTTKRRVLRGVSAWLIAIAGSLGAANSAQATFLPLPDLSAITNSILNPHEPGPVEDLVECTLDGLTCLSLDLDDCLLLGENCEEELLPLDLTPIGDSVHEIVGGLSLGGEGDSLACVPEPGTMLLLATGVVGLMVRRRLAGR